MRIALLLVIMLLGLCGCEDDERMHKLTAPKSAEMGDPFTVDMKNGQCVVTIGRDDFNQWLNSHAGIIKIVSISSVDFSGHGSTTGFMVVYEKK